MSNRFTIDKCLVSNLACSIYLFIYIIKLFAFVNILIYMLAIARQTAGPHEWAEFFLRNPRVPGLKSRNVYFSK